MRLNGEWARVDPVMLCQHCQQREALVHLTRVIGDKVERFDLCSACFSALENPEHRQVQHEIAGAVCQYCGRKADSGGFDPFGLMAGLQQKKFFCTSCFEEYQRFIQKELEDKSLDGQATIIQTVLAAADEHMKRWAR